MYKIKCPVCGSGHTQKNGCRNGVQLYRCRDCRYQFRNTREIDPETLWRCYQDGKQTIYELATQFHVSESTIKRRLCAIVKVWQQPPLSGGGYVNLDACYWGHNFGVMLALDSASGCPLYMAFIRNETTADFLNAIESIEHRGYIIKGIIIDGKRSLFSLFSHYRIQMCQFHMKQIVRRYISLNPRLKAARALKSLMDGLTTTTREQFISEYRDWKQTWHETLYRKSLLKSGKSRFRHRRLRSAMNSIEFYLPYLFTFQDPECVGMPNTNNKIEGTFTDLKKNLNNHSGMSQKNRKRFISGFFLALAASLSMKKPGNR